ncbi:MAG: hypothetical protein PHY92_00940 [Alphaproteobacteria bacterium]|nr:hypothetical protein [Alphaproteobacteria bacterium]
MHQASEQENLTSQWITSLAISVVCCAALFLVFAGYMMDLHEKTGWITSRLEFYMERQNQLTTEVDILRRQALVMPLAPAAVPPSVPNAAPNVAPPPAVQPNAAQPVETPAPSAMKPVPPAPSAPAMQPAPPAAKPIPGKAPLPGKAPASKP